MFEKDTTPRNEGTTNRGICMKKSKDNHVFVMLPLQSKVTALPSPLLHVIPTVTVGMTSSRKMRASSTDNSKKVGAMEANNNFLRSG